jgi:hypothetical protein
VLSNELYQLSLVWFVFAEEFKEKIFGDWGHSIMSVTDADTIK